jgi:hypothetical protein
MIANDESRRLVDFATNLNPYIPKREQKEADAEPGDVQAQLAAHVRMESETADRKTDENDKQNTESTGKTENKEADRSEEKDKTHNLENPVIPLELDRLAQFREFIIGEIVQLRLAGVILVKDRDARSPTLHSKEEESKKRIVNITVTMEIMSLRIRVRGNDGSRFCTSRTLDNILECFTFVLTERNSASLLTHRWMKMLDGSGCPERSRG